MPQQPLCGHRSKLSQHHPQTRGPCQPAPQWVRGSLGASRLWSCTGDGAKTQTAVPSPLLVPWAGASCREDGFTEGPGKRARPRGEGAPGQPGQAWQTHFPPYLQQQQLARPDRQWAGWGLITPGPRSPGTMTTSILTATLGHGMQPRPGNREQSLLASWKGGPLSHMAVLGWRAAGKAGAGALVCCDSWQRRRPCLKAPRGQRLQTLRPPG